MEKKEKPRMVKCPKCPEERPAGARRVQFEHTETEHPEIIARNLEKLGLSHLERMLD